MGRTPVSCEAAFAVPFEPGPSGAFLVALKRPLRWVPYRDFAFHDQCSRDVALKAARDLAAYFAPQVRAVVDEIHQHTCDRVFDNEQQGSLHGEG
jgi:hypothetical protein